MSFKFSEILKPNMGLIDPSPLSCATAFYQASYQVRLQYVKKDKWIKHILWKENDLQKIGQDFWP